MITMSWKDEIKKFDNKPFDKEEFNRRMKERDEANLRSGGGVDENNPIHTTVERIIKEHGYGESAEKVIERLKLRMKWLKKNADYGGKD